MKAMALCVVLIRLNQFLIKDALFFLYIRYMGNTPVLTQVCPFLTQGHAAFIKVFSQKLNTGPHRLTVNSWSKAHKITYSIYGVFKNYSPIRQFLDVRSHTLKTLFLQSFILIYSLVLHLQTIIKRKNQKELKICVV